MIDVTVGNIVIELLIGALLGVVISTTGVGGGIIVLPVLSYFFGLNALAAVATANLLSMLMKLSSSAMHYRLGNIALQPAMLLLAIMLPSTFSASYAIAGLAQISGWHAHVQLGINVIIVLTILTSLYLFSQRMHHPPTRLQVQGAPGVRPLLLPAAGAGIVIGATGVGGGVVVLPMLMRYARMNIKQAIGTSAFVTMVLSGGSALAYSRSGFTDLPLAAMLFLGSLFSIPLAKYLLQTLSERAFQYITFTFIAGSAVAMTWKLFMPV